MNKQLKKFIDREAEKGEEKESLIQSIEGLFPADSDYHGTKETGEHLLIQALCHNWRSLPVEVLRTYNGLCLRKENS